MSSPTARFSTLSALAGASVVLLALTIVSSQWMEALFGIELDGGSGAFEWSVVLALAATALTAGALGRAVWRRRAAASAHS